VTFPAQDVGNQNPVTFPAQDVGNPSPVIFPAQDVGKKSPVTFPAQDVESDWQKPSQFVKKSPSFISVDLPLVLVDSAASSPSLTSVISTSSTAGDALCKGTFFPDAVLNFLGFFYLFKGKYLGSLVTLKVQFWIYFCWKALIRGLTSVCLLTVEDGSYWKYSYADSVFSREPNFPRAYSANFNADMPAQLDSVFSYLTYIYFVKVNWTHRRFHCISLPAILSKKEHNFQELKLN
jgi:hypothetical protein